MFWADKYVDKILTNERVKEKIEKGEILIVRDEKTASGRVHVGSMRGVAVHGIVARILNERGIKAKFLFEINDVDPMDDIPGYLDEETFRPHFMKPLNKVPSPEEGYENYAELYGQEFEQVIRDAGFDVEFYRAHELYESGKMNEYIRTALDQREKIRKIYFDISRSQKNEDWYPVTIIAPVCEPGQPTVTGWNGKEVTYTCESGETGSISPFDGNAKLAWKPEWAAKFAAVNVDIEGAGKDHSTKGGSRDVARAIVWRVFEYPNPFDIPYEFLLVGGRKMSSSKGRGATSKDISSLLPRQIFRLLLLGKDPKQQVNFDPEGDTIPLLYDQYDRIAEKYWSSAEDDNARLFELVHIPDDPLLEERFMPRFSQVAFLVQMPHLDFLEEMTKLKGDALTVADTRECEERAAYARKWLDLYAPEDYKFDLQFDTVPEKAQNLSSEIKAAIKELLEYIEANESLDGQELHTKLHDIRKETDVEPKAFFSAIYFAFLGKESGPKAGWFLSVLERDFLLRRLNEVAA